MMMSGIINCLIQEITPIRQVERYQVYCVSIVKKGTRIQLVLTPFKISVVVLVSKIKSSLKANVVYQFSCASCNASYVGETSRHLAIRVNEHLYKDKNSHIFKHLNASSECKEVFHEDCFSILNNASSKYQLPGDNTEIIWAHRVPKARKTSVGGLEGAMSPPVGIGNIIFWVFMCKKAIKIRFARV